MLGKSIIAAAVLALALAAPASAQTGSYASVNGRLLPNGQLAILPGSDHFAPVQRSDWIVSQARAFLEAPMPKAN